MSKIRFQTPYTPMKGTYEEKPVIILTSLLPGKDHSVPKNSLYVSEVDP